VHVYVPAATAGRLLVEGYETVAGVWRATYPGRHFTTHDLPEGVPARHWLTSYWLPDVVG
jgi:hypothetical protein